MKKNLYFFLLLTCFTFCEVESFAQSTPFPSQEPPWGQIGDWGHGNGSSWELNFLPFKYRTLPFRLMPPNGVTYTKGTNGAYYGEWNFSEPNKKYPLILFLHGYGELGTDNQDQLVHGARTHRDAVLSGEFPGYLLYPQCENGFWAGGNAIFSKEIIDLLIQNNNVDPNRIYVHGLSAGGSGTWEMLTQYPQTFAAGIPMSAIGPAAYIDRVSSVVEIPIWIGQGGLDRRPSPEATQQLRDALIAQGANVKYSFYPNLGHGIWNTMYADPDFFPYMLRNKKNQIHVFGGRTNFCEGEQINVDLGVTGGFSGYEWRRGSTIIATNTNRIHVQVEGTYTMRFRRGNEWTEWSDPVVIQFTGPTPPVDITASGSVHFPTLNGATSVTLSAPNGYKSYAWSNGSTSQSIQVSNAGSYRVAVTAFNGCPGEFSDPIIVTLNSTQGPPPPTNLISSAISETQVSLSWNAAGSTHDGYELYRGLQENGPYELLQILGKNANSYSDSELTPNTTYFYQIRAFNSQGASAYKLTAIATFQDVEGPSQPTKFEVVSTSDKSVTLSWTSSIDNVDGLGSLVYDLSYNGNVIVVNNSNSTVFPVNSALGKQTSASRIENSSRGNELAVDGDLNTFWSSGQDDVDVSDWIYVDLASSFNISAVTLTWGNDYAVDYKLQVSSDATTWQDILTVENNADRYKTHKNLNSAGRYLRVLCNKRRGNNWRYYINELEVYGSNLEGYDQPTIVTQIKGLTTGNLYAFTLKARDKAGNSSISTGQITAPAVNQGLKYKYYHNISFNNLGELVLYSPSNQGTLQNFSLSPRENTSNYAIVYDGYINVQNAGLYTFFTRSQDGSNLSISNFQIVDNDGRHGNQERSGQIVLAQGTYPIHVEYFNQGSGGNVLEVRWQGPGISKQLIPNAAMNTNYTAPTPPAMPTNVTATGIAYNQIRLNWNDNSSNENGFEIYHSLSPLGPFALAGSVGANVTTFVDDKLLNETKYYYQVRAIGPSGESAPNVGSVTGTGLDYKYYEINNLSNLPDFDAYTPKKTGHVNNVTLNVRDRNDDFSFQFTGYIDIPTAGQYTFYTTSDDGSKLYINNNVVVNNDGLHGNQTRSGVMQFDAAGFYAIKVEFFERGGGESLTVEYQGPGIARQNIPNAAFKAIEYTNATTLPLPPLPNPPGNVQANGISTTSIQITWNDASNNETGFSIFRAPSGSSNFSLIGSVGANIVNYTDIGLALHTQYRYQVAANGVQGQSNLSPIVNGSTVNTNPEIEPVSDVTLRVNSTLEINITASDEDQDEVYMSVTQKPNFVSVVQSIPGLITLSISPTQIGTSTVQILAEDNFGGTRTVSFDIIVNENYLPVITPIEDITIEENSSYSLAISASDFDEEDDLTFTVMNLPSFATFTDNLDGTATLELNPDYTSNGIYPISVKVSDSKAVITESFTVTVNDISVSKTYFVNFHNNSAAPSPWNNISNASAGSTISNMIDNTGASSGLSLALLNSWTGANDFGANTGNNSGVYPDAVIKSFFYEQSTGVKTFRISGLNTDLRYAFRFFASRDNAGSSAIRNTKFTINGQTVTLDAMGNTSNTVVISNVASDINGQLTIDIQKQDVYTAYAYINALEIISYYDNGMAPAAPQLLSATAVSTTQIDLVWTDLTPNETGYTIYRAPEETGPFEVIGTVGINTTSYTDLTAGGSNWYRITATNSNGESAPSNILGVTLSNSAPIIAPINNISVAENQIRNIQITATDLEGDAISFTAEGLPYFASLTDNLDGTANLTVNPSTGDAGNYNVRIVATDEQDASNFKDIVIEVSEKLILSTYINFNLGSNAGSPWNNFNAQPLAGTTKTNLLNELGENAGLTVTLVSQWQGSNTTGVVTGNNSGVYPDNVMKTYYYDITNNIKTVRVGGLDANNAYNFIFFASRDDDGDRTTVYTIGNKSVSLNASRNSTKTVRINGIKGDASGNLLIQMQKTSGSAFAYINAMVVESYEDSGAPITPSELAGVGASQTSVKLSWSDNSVNETGFRIYRRDLSQTNFTLIHTTNADVSSYTNTGLQTNTTYVYKVAAFNALGASGFTDDVYVSTLLYSIYINANSGFNQGQPWNNLNTVPIVGTRRTSFRDQSWVNRDVYLEVVAHPNLTTFGGANPYGMVPGGTGIYPDNVIRTFWFLEATEAARMEIGNLSPSLTYNFVFFGSRDGSGNRNTDYTINGNTVTLNASFNISNTVQINGVQPDGNGRVYIDIVSSAGSQYGYLNALVIQAYNEIPILNGARLATNIVKSEFEDNELVVEDSHNLSNYFEVFPNPVSDQLTVLMNTLDEEKVEIVIYDQLGHHLFNTQGHSNQEKNKHEIDFSNFAAGVYFMRITVNDKQTEIIRLIKE